MSNREDHSASPAVDPEIIAYYESASEDARLELGPGRLEQARTREILGRVLPAAPAVICDVGGASGVYACWLAGLGYAVHLVDPVRRHVEQARARAAGPPERPLAGIVQGDARALPFDDASADAVLLLGPLYHLVDREDRLGALREARRVVRPGGAVVAAAISRFASTLDGLITGAIDDPAFRAIAARGRREGRHRNPSADPRYFTTAFFHDPTELSVEIRDAGLDFEHTLAVEGPGWLLQNLEAVWADAARRENLLEAVRALEREPSLLGASAHLLALARRPA